VRISQRYTAKAKLRRPCFRCRQPILPGEVYHKRCIRTEKCVEHANCPTGQQPEPVRRVRKTLAIVDKRVKQAQADRIRKKIMHALDAHIADGGLVTAPDRLVDRVYGAIFCDD
jgi:hypothetical protein